MIELSHLRVLRMKTQRPEGSNAPQPWGGRTAELCHSLPKLFRAHPGQTPGSKREEGNWPDPCSQALTVQWLMDGMVLGGLKWGRELLTLRSGGTELEGRWKKRAEQTRHGLSTLHYWPG